MRDDDPYATWDAAYVLGSLSGNERREYEAHLATCARCRAAVAELSGMPALLAQLDAEEVEALDDAAAEAPPMRPEVLDYAAAKGRVAAPSLALGERDHAGRRGRRAGGRRWSIGILPGIRGPRRRRCQPMASAA